MLVILRYEALDVLEVFRYLPAGLREFEGYDVAEDVLGHYPAVDHLLEFRWHVGVATHMLIDIHPPAGSVLMEEQDR